MKSIFLQKIVVVLLLMFFGIKVIAQDALKDKYEFTGNARVNKKTKIVEAKYNINSKIYSGATDDIAKRYLEENKNEFGIKDISDLKKIETIKSPAGNHVGYIQTYKGVPVFGSETVVSLNKENRVTMVVNGNRPLTGLKGTIAQISKESAVSAAIAKLSVEEATLISKPKAELCIYPDSTDNYTLTWKVNFIAKKPGGDWQIFVDATSGIVLNTMNIAERYTTGSGRVFKPDPITRLNNTTLSDRGDSNYSALINAYRPVTLNNLNESVGGQYRLMGKYAWSENLDNGQINTVERPTSSFEFYRDEPGFEETSAYFFIDTIRTYIGNLGFAPQWKDQNNILQDYIRYDAHAGGSCEYSPTD